MIIKVKESQLFLTDPAVRFANTYKVSDDIYRDLWKRHVLLEYTISELCEVFYIKVGKPINKRSMSEWIFRGKVYSKVKDKIKHGALAINSDIFEELEQRVLNELFKHVRCGDTKSVRSLA